MSRVELVGGPLDGRIIDVPPTYSFRLYPPQPLHPGECVYVAGKPVADLEIRKAYYEPQTDSYPHPSEPPP